MRKIAPFTLMHSRRIFTNAQSIDRAEHIRDRPYRSLRHGRAMTRHIAIGYLG
jgi:hypothetical protein